MQRKFVFVAALLLLALVALTRAQMAQAHSEPAKCTPPIDGTVATAPAQVVCQVTASLDAAKSKLTVVNAAGEQVDKGDSAVDLTDPDRKTISVSLDVAKITDGVYTIRWETFSTEDNEEANGEFKFTVGSGSPAQPTAAATLAPTEAPTLAPTVAATTAAEPTATVAAPEPTAAPTPVTTLPGTGAAVSNLGFAFVAFLGLLVMGFGLMLRARR